MRQIEQAAFTVGACVGTILTVMCTEMSPLAVTKINAVPVPVTFVRVVMGGTSRPLSKND